MGTLAEEIVELRSRLADMTDQVLELSDRIAKVEIAQTELARSVLAKKATDRPHTPKRCPHCGGEVV